MKPDWAVLIPSLNSPILDQVVAAVLRQDGFERVAELLIVGRDEPRRLERCASLSGRVRLLDTGRPVSEPVARNLGLAASTAARLVFLDSDCVPQAGWLQGHLKAHCADAGAPLRLVSGAVRAAGDGYWALVYNLSMFYAFVEGAPAGPRAALPTLNLSFPRRLAEAVGPFDETLPRCTDVDWTLRARAGGWPLVFEPAAVVEHRHARRSLAAVWRDCAGSGRHSRDVRARHARLVAAPALLRSGWLLRALGPAAAAWVTAGVLLRWPATFRGRWPALPGFWLTKLAWCWGAGSRPENLGSRRRIVLE